MSCYAPAWVKRDQARFPAARDAMAAASRSCRRSRREPRHRRACLRRADASSQRLRRRGAHRRHGAGRRDPRHDPERREIRPDATALFAGAVPAELMAYLRWRHAGPATPELEAAWRAARAQRRHLDGGLRAGPRRPTRSSWPGTSRASRSGDRRQQGECALPMFVNAALIRPGYQPGQYPSAGPLPHLIDRLARRCASHRLSRRTSTSTFVEWTAAVPAARQPLFVPEALRSPEASANSLYAFGEHDAIGFSPFAIEAISGPAATLLAASNDVLAQIGPLVARHQGRHDGRPAAGASRQPSAAAGAPERPGPRRDLRARRAGLAGGRRRDRSGRGRPPRRGPPAVS